MVFDDCTRSCFPHRENESRSLDMVMTRMNDDELLT